MKNDPLEQFYKKFVGKGEDALEQDEEPGKTFYVPRLEESPDKDPIQALWRRINLAESESVNLLTGFRGNGKSTELRRLKKRLEGSGCVVFLVDMLSYVFISKPIEITDFTLSLMAALDDAAKMLEETKGFKLASLRQNYWERLGNFLKTVKLDSITLKTSLADFGFTLKTDALFKAKVQEHLKGHFTEIKRQANAFVSAIVDGIQKQSRNDGC